MGKVDLKKLLSEKIPKEYIEFLPSSFDLVGSKSGQVAIVRIDERVEKFEEEIARAIMTLHKNVKTVIRRYDQRKGDFRLYDYKILAGQDTEVVHKEYGYYIKVDPVKVYFSPRDAEDRIDIAKSTKAGENILYLFAGVVPYAIAIAKINPLVNKIVAIEKNEVAYKYALENVKLNKLEGKVICILGDVREVYKSFLGFADRVLMTLPLGSYDFLDIALQTVKKEGGIIHYYEVGPAEDPFKAAEERISSFCRVNSYTYDILKRKIVSEYAPGKYKVRIDVFVRPDEDI